MSGFPKPKVVPIGSARRAKKNASREGLLIDDLARSGIDSKTAKKLRIRACDSDEAWALLHPKNPTGCPKDFTAEVAWFPYWNPDGSEMNYGRARILRGRWSDKDDGKRRRYRNPANTLPHVYLPVPLLDWKQSNGKLVVPDSRLAITEGEKKAITAALYGIACIALGGINSESSARHGVALLQEFDWFDWPQLEAEVAYDSDVYGAKEGGQAMYGVGYTLRREKHPKSLVYVRFTTEGHEKTALDDFLAAYSDRELGRRAYYKVERKSDQINEAFAKYDSEIVQVRKKVRYYNVATRTFYPGQRGVVEEYGVGQWVLSEDGDKRVLPITLWLTERNPKLTTVTDVVYAPGKEPRFKASEADEFETLNEWRPTRLMPIPYGGDEDSIRPWLEFNEYLAPELTDEQREWWLDWMAYPLQNLGRKTRQAVLIWSEANGTGKNTAGNVLIPMYGSSNVMEIDGTSLISKYNDWTQHQFVVINEVRAATYAEREAVMARLKTYITQDTLDLDRKFMPRENVPNHLHLLLTSNYPDALLLDEDDRRFFVIKGPGREQKWSERQFKAFCRWLETGGRERVFGYLRARDLESFNPNGAALRTVAREAMIRGNSNVLSDVVQLLCDDPLQVVSRRIRDGAEVRRPAYDLFTPMRLIERLNDYAREHNMRLPAVTVRMLGAELGKRKVPKEECEMPERKKVTLYAILDPEKWKKRPRKEWRGHYEAHYGKEES